MQRTSSCDIEFLAWRAELLTWSEKLLEGFGLRVISRSPSSIRELKLESNIYSLFIGFDFATGGKKGYC